MKNLLFASIFFVLALTSSCSRSPASYVNKGNQLLSQGKFDDGVLNYRKAIQKDANYGPAYLALGKAQLQHKDLAAYESLLRASQLMPSNDEAQVQFGDLAVSVLVQEKSHPQSLYDQVTKLKNTFLKRDPNSFDGLRWKGYLAMVDRKPAEAVESFTKARQLKPADAVVASALVESLFQAGRATEGEKLGLEQIQNRTATPELYDALYWHYRGIHHQEDAESVIKNKVAAFPSETEYVFQLALHYERTGNAAELKRVLADFIQKKGDYLARLQVGDFYMAVGRIAEATAIFEEGAKSDPKNAATYKKRLANAYMDSARLKEAQALVDQMSQQNPTDRGARAVRASLWSRSNNPADVDRAIPEFQDLLKQTPQDSILHFGLCQALWRKGKLDDAHRECQTSVSGNPNSAPPRYILAEIAVAQNNATELLRQGQELVRLQPSSVRANRLDAMGLAQNGRTEEARNIFRRILNANPTDNETRSQLALLEIGAKQFRAAEQVLQAGSSGKDPAADLRLLPAWVQLRVGENQPKQAIALLTEASRKQPDNASIRLMLARTAARIGEYGTAIDQYKYLASQTKSAELYYELARTQELRGDSRAALTSYEDMKRSAPGDARADFGMGRVCEMLGQNAAAIAHYENAAHMNYDDPQLFVNLSFLLSDSGGNLDRAVELARRAQAKLPDNPVVVDALAYAYLKKNITDSAMPVFNGLVKKYPKASTYRYHLALALLQKGDKTSAKRELEACLKNPEPDRQTEKIHALLASLR
ncbi:MAG: tetratricopeptide repeat protein [Acidobacteriia bacterium]|nr:tetratricopeptide repeat protein [Terriglobia bacterium]